MSMKQEQLRELANLYEIDPGRSLGKQLVAAAREYADRLDAVAVSDEVAQNAYVVFANLHPRLRDGWVHDYDIDVPAMRAAIESILPIADEQSKDAIVVPREIYDRLPNKETVTVADLRHAIASAKGVSTHD